LAVLQTGILEVSLFVVVNSTVVLNFVTHCHSTPSTRWPWIRDRKSGRMSASPTRRRWPAVNNGVIHMQPAMGEAMGRSEEKQVARAEECGMF